MTSSHAHAARAKHLPRVGFAGVGWIGKNRLEAMAAAGEVEIAAVADPVPGHCEAIVELAPNAEQVSSFAELLKLELDAVVIATPSAQHAEQAIAALERGLAVFCQKPVGRNLAEARAIVQAAKRSGTLLAGDLCYRHTAAFASLNAELRAGTLGNVFGARLAFHNAYGPDKPWFYDARLSGGGCLIDLGTHLVDLALWLLRDDRVCSWNLPAGKDAIIAAEVYGTRGGASVTNIGGSFYDFAAYRHDGTIASPLTVPPDAWSGRAISEWGRRLAAGAGYDASCESLVEVARIVDALYHSAGVLR